MGVGLALYSSMWQSLRQWEVVAIVVLAAIMQGMVFDRDALLMLCCRGCGRVVVVVLAACVGPRNPAEWPRGSQRCVSNVL